MIQHEGERIEIPTHLLINPPNWIYVAVKVLLEPLAQRLLPRQLHVQGQSLVRQPNRQQDINHSLVSIIDRTSEAICRSPLC